MSSHRPQPCIRAGTLDVSGSKSFAGRPRKPPNRLSQGSPSSSTIASAINTPTSSMSQQQSPPSAGSSQRLDIPATSATVADSDVSPTSGPTTKKSLPVVLPLQRAAPITREQTSSMASSVSNFSASASSSQKRKILQPRSIRSNPRNGRSILGMSGVAGKVKNYLEDSQGKKYQKVRGYNLPLFGPDALIIYIWPYPRPSNFLTLGPSNKAFKTNQDAIERQADIDPELDNWGVFVGDIEYHDNNFNTMCHAIAQTLASRAKRCFRKGMPWAYYADLETSCDSVDAARDEAKKYEDPAKKKIIMAEALDNNLRLAVFEAISERLCNEIWLEAYPGSSLLGQEKRDSKLDETSARAAGQKDPRREQRNPSSTPVADLGEDGRPVPKGWSKDKYGFPQPFYGEEEKAPHHLQDHRAEFLQQVKDNGGRIPRPGPEPSIPGTRHNGLFRGLDPHRGTRDRNMVEQIVGGEPDFETSDEEGL